MRGLYARAEVRATLSAKTAAEQRLSAPVSVYRQATATGQLNGCPDAKDSLFVLAIGEASQHADGRSLVFMDDSWSQCSATFGCRDVAGCLEKSYKRVKKSGSLQLSIRYERKPVGSRSLLCSFVKGSAEGAF